MNQILTQERLKSLLNYDPEMGVFYWLVAKGPRMKAGDIAGGRNTDGYIRIKIDGKRYGAHRLAFLYMEGLWPKHHVDHKYRDPGDNRWQNLRPATDSQNKYNRLGWNELGVKGVYPSGKKFRVRLAENGERKCFGTFDTLEQAAIVSLQHQIRIQGEFQCS